MHFRQLQCLHRMREASLPGTFRCRCCRRWQPNLAITGVWTGLGNHLPQLAGSKTSKAAGATDTPHALHLPTCQPLLRLLGSCRTRFGSTTMKTTQHTQSGMCVSFIHFVSCQLEATAGIVSVLTSVSSTFSELWRAFTQFNMVNVVLGWGVDGAWVASIVSLTLRTSMVF